MTNRNITKCHVDDIYLSIHTDTAEIHRISYTGKFIMSPKYSFTNSDGIKFYLDHILVGTSINVYNTIWVNNSRNAKIIRTISNL